MLWPTGRRDGLGFLPYSFGGNLALQRTRFKGSERYSIFINEQHARTAGSPDGYSAGGAYVLPIRAGSVSSWQSQIIFTGSGDVLAGGPMIGSGSLTLVGTGDISLITSLSGTTSATFVGSGSVALTIGMGGSGAITFSGNSGLSMIIPVEGSGFITFAGSGDVRSRLSMSGSWSPFTTLSPESLATAVWQELNINGIEYGTVLTSAEKNAKLAAALSA
jgi:hypothetical protein